MKILEVACGTGRFMTFARDNLPLDAEFTGVDLSPFYLNNAKKNDRNWRSVRERTEAARGDVTTPVAPANFVQANGEELPFGDADFDAVVCMYLYHEIPRAARARVSAEMARVAKPGGKIVLVDACQRGDRPGTDKFIGAFANMNEPHWLDYVDDILPTHFEMMGMACATKTVRGSTKALVFDKCLEYNSDQYARLSP